MDVIAIADWAQGHPAKIPLLTVVASGMLSLLTTYWAISYKARELRITADAKGREVKISADHQITDGFARLVERLQAELVNASEERRDMKEQIRELSRQVEELTSHIGNLEAIMASHGIKPPARGGIA